MIGYVTSKDILAGRQFEIFTPSATASWKRPDSNVRAAASKLYEERSGYRPAMSDSREMDGFRLPTNLELDSFVITTDTYRNSRKCRPPMFLRELHLANQSHDLG